MQIGDHLYGVVRSDMPIGYQSVQSSHALLKFAVDHPEKFREWYRRSEYLCVLQVKDEQELTKLLHSAKMQNIRCSAFREPDVNYSITAIAIESGRSSRELLKSLPLALKNG